MPFSDFFQAIASAGYVDLDACIDVVGLKYRVMLLLFWTTG